MTAPYVTKALTKYYKRTKGKIVFADNSSLNELAWKMWDYDSYLGIDPSVLSKILYGKRSFTPKQLFVFCQVLQINANEKKWIFQCLFNDYLLKNGVDPFHTFYQ